MNHNDAFAGRVGFCVGTGRCGTTFLAELAKREPGVAACHERQRLGATFHMFCKWHGIAVDAEGFILAREQAIRADLASSDFSLESSALLSHSLEELYQRFGARFLLLVRNPADTVASFAVRNWFVVPPARADTNLPPSYEGREGEKARHFLGRIIPGGDEFERWTEMTPLGRIAWFWKARNLAILQQFRRLPVSVCRIQRLEDLDWQQYREVARFFGWESQLDATTFSELAAARLNSGPHRPRRPGDWTPTEIAEFETEVGTLASALGYSFRISEVTNPCHSKPQNEPPPLLQVLDRVNELGSKKARPGLL